MIFRLKQTMVPRARMAFTLAEVLICIMIVALTVGGIIYGYVQANRFAEWSSMSLAAESYASQGVERVKAARWITYDATGASINDLADQTIRETNAMIIPGSGRTNTVFTTTVISTVSQNPHVRQIMATCVWTFPLTGQSFSNTVVTLRAPDA